MGLFAYSCRNVKKVYIWRYIQYSEL